jgi:pimeloyl-ACP methyl ester carboxylesterase
MKALINGAQLHYERAGEGPPVVFLHAGVADSRMWEPQVKACAEQFDVICPDMRGFGKSELPPMRWSPVADLLALMDELHVNIAHLVGCSIGAKLAIDFAVQHAKRVSKLMLVGPGIGGARFGEKYPELGAEVDAAEKAGEMDAVNRAEMHLWLDGRRPRGYVRQPLRDLFLEMNGGNFQSDFKSAPMDELDPPAVERLQEITAPTLIVIGDADLPPVFDAVELLMERVRHARKVMIDDAAHLPNLEHPDEFNRLVLEFLRA